ncbi:MAG: FapA family protein [Mesobacillus sp.]|uniref:FapA family protein n=1 Tax=Mesobacillus sp. TaxID=2675271 RepID=UPI003C6369A0
MVKAFEVKLTKDRLTAVLDLKDHEKIELVSPDSLTELLMENHITVGVLQDVLDSVASNPSSVKYPITVAEGKPALNGEDAYLRNEIKEMNHADKEAFNFRVVLHIPSVTKGQLLATEIPAGEGIDGLDVTGRQIRGRKGRPLRIKAGNNVLYKSGKFYSMIDGKVSITNTSISVNPVFEVKGDLDLKTGNLDFVGNITIRGNIPSGYELKAGGDIWVHGLVEASSLQAAGNIIIHGGVAGGMKGSISAGGNVLVNYLNQANVKAGQDVIVKTSILHSRVTAGGNVDCRTGTLIGGTISAGRNIFVKGLGNELFTKTELAVGWDPTLEKSELETVQSIEKAKANIQKLTEIEVKITEIVKQTGKLTEEQQGMISKQRATRLSIENSLLDLSDELHVLQAEKQDRLNSTLMIFDRVFPNTKVYFGKYAQVTNQVYKQVRFSLENSEISIHPLAEAEKVSH